ncbi:MAG: hypothetical protein MUO87_08075, partial [Thermoplasmata archaeon]|nr:hypothetical protein [Thermoplasmata archaeon]
MASVRLLIESIRSFGGDLSASPIWVLLDRELEGDFVLPSELEAETLPMTIPESICHYELADKVCACAEAERKTSQQTRSLVWLSHDTLVVNPPVLFSLDSGHDAALRPVHIRNVGVPVAEPLDDFWSGVFECVGLADTDYSVESFVDGQTIRAYSNSHSYSVDPSVGLFRRWLECFEKLVCDPAFQDSSCSDDLHMTFLHQAVLSALTVAMMPPERIQIIPTTYSYPYNLQSSVPSGNRAKELNQLVSVVYEDLPLHPDYIE